MHIDAHTVLREMVAQGICHLRCTVAEGESMCMCMCKQQAAMRPTSLACCNQRWATRRSRSPYSPLSRV